MNNKLVLYEEYIKELAIDMSKDEMRKAVMDMATKPYYQWNSIADDNGFVIIGLSPDCHPDADYFIVETYLRKEFRGKGIMSTFLKEYIKENPGVYCLWVLHNNEHALNFWNHVFRESGYVPKDLSVIPGTFDKNVCEQYGFMPKE